MLNITALTHACPLGKAPEQCCPAVGEQVSGQYMQSCFSSAGMPGTRKPTTAGAKPSSWSSRELAVIAGQKLGQAPIRDWMRGNAWLLD